jgi:peptide/nickel transport system permease protein
METTVTTCDPHKPAISTATEVRPELPVWKQWLQLLLNDKVAVLSLVFLLALLVATIVVPHLMGDSASKMNMPDRFIRPGLTTGHVLGTDQLGRDMIGRILLASRVSLMTAFLVVVLSLVFGVALGVLAGFYGGLFDDLIMRFVDVAMGFPSLLLALIVIYALGPSVTNVIIVLAATRWMLYTRVARAETIKLKRLQYVEASQGLGSSDLHVMLRHILPNLASVLFTLATMEIAVVILAESSLSFLGLGIQPPDASLGLLIAQGKEYITTSWWVMFFPGVAIFAATMALSLLSNWLGIALDPVQRWRLTSVRRAARA